MAKILPLPQYTDYYVDIANSGTLGTGYRNSSSKSSLPKIDSLIAWGVVQPQDILRAKGRDSEAVLQNDGKVIVSGTAQKVSLQQWLKKVYGWSAVETYSFTVDVKSGKTLSELRQDYIDHQESMGQIKQNSEK